MRESDPYDFDDSDIDYDPITEEHHLSFDPGQVSRPTMVVVQLISHITDTSPLSLPPLHSAVETDSLDTWLSATREHVVDFETKFTYAGHQITLNSRGDIWAQPIDDTAMDVDEDGSA